MKEETLISLIKPLIRSDSPVRTELLIEAIVEATRQSSFAKAYILVVLTSKHFHIQFTSEKVSLEGAVAFYRGKLNRIEVYKPFFNINSSFSKEKLTPVLLHEFWHAFLTILHVVGHDVKTFPPERNVLELALPVIPVDDKHIEEIKHLLRQGRLLLANALARYIKDPDDFYKEFPQLAKRIKAVAEKYIPRTHLHEMPQKPVRNRIPSCEEQFVDYSQTVEKKQVIQERDVDGLPIILFETAFDVADKPMVCTFQYFYGRLSWSREDSLLFSAFIDTHKLNEFYQLNAPHYIADYRKQFFIAEQYIPWFLATEEEAKHMEVGVYLPIFFMDLLERHWQDILHHKDLYSSYPQTLQTHSSIADFKKIIKKQAHYREEIDKLAQHSIPLDKTEEISTTIVELCQILDRRHKTETPTFANIQRQSRWLDRDGHLTLQHGYAYTHTDIVLHAPLSYRLPASSGKMEKEESDCEPPQAFLESPDQVSSASRQGSWLSSAFRWPLAVRDLFIVNAATEATMPAVTSTGEESTLSRPHSESDAFAVRSDNRMFGSRDLASQFMLAVVFAQMISNGMNAVRTWWNASPAEKSYLTEAQKTALDKHYQDQLSELKDRLHDHYCSLYPVYNYFLFSLEELEYDIKDFCAQTTVEVNVANELTRAIGAFKKELNHDINRKTAYMATNSLELHQPSFFSPSSSTRAANPLLLAGSAETCIVRSLHSNST